MDCLSVVVPAPVVYIDFVGATLSLYLYIFDGGLHNSDAHGHVVPLDATDTVDVDIPVGDRHVRRASVYYTRSHARDAHDTNAYYMPARAPDAAATFYVDEFGRMFDSI